MWETNINGSQFPWEQSAVATKVGKGRLTFELRPLHCCMLDD